MFWYLLDIPMMYLISLCIDCSNRWEGIAWRTNTTTSWTMMDMVMMQAWARDWTRRIDSVDGVGTAVAVVAARYIAATGVHVCVTAVTSL